MAQYIDKDALVAEIDKRLHQLTDAAFDSMIGRNLIEIKDFLDTLEVKEVQEEPVSEDLEEAAKERVDAEDYCCVDEDGMPLYDSDYLEYMFKEGAQWQKQQMMKESVEVRIRYINSDICAFSKEFTKYMDGVRGGSKVKLIIIKEE